MCMYVFTHYCCGSCSLAARVPCVAATVTVFTGAPVVCCSHRHSILFTGAPVACCSHRHSILFTGAPVVCCSHRHFTGAPVVCCSHRHSIHWRTCRLARLVPGTSLSGRSRQHAAVFSRPRDVTRRRAASGSGASAERTNSCTAVELRRR